jgi:flavin reductase (DIM6/NTAB) family NADH-FMN oxidoreductase RutF
MSANPSLHFRHVLGHFATGVSLVTGIAADGEPAGLAVGSFMSVSLEPRLIAICPATTSVSWPVIRAGGRFCVNILGEHQECLARAFAVSGGSKFEGVGWRAGETGSPIIDDVVAWIDCEIESDQVAGDHWLVLGKVKSLDVENTNQPLLFHRGEFGRLVW